ncbi:hypothetical protein [Absidia glauca]|uniref:Uncharacterized protein n=1 Tax=Absidia glauca TaxID=4829 RepID=A0A163MML8_ABSGL|nr:hypothetical protein [Absidia glauca]
MGWEDELCVTDWMMGFLFKFDNAWCVIGCNSDADGGPCSSPPTLTLSSPKVPKSPQKSQSRLDTFHLFRCSAQMTTVIQGLSPRYALYGVTRPFDPSYPIPSPMYVVS